MKRLLTILFLLTGIACYPQQGNPRKGTIKVAGSRCDSVYIVIPTAKGLKNGTLTYSELQSASGFVLELKDCLEDRKLSISSYEIAINGGKKQVRYNPAYNFRSIPASAQPFTITVSNCVITVTKYMEEPKTLLIPYAEFTVLPGG